MILGLGHTLYGLVVAVVMVTSQSFPIESENTSLMGSHHTVTLSNHGLLLSGFTTELSIKILLED